MKDFLNKAIGVFVEIEPSEKKQEIKQEQSFVQPQQFVQQPQPQFVQQHNFTRPSVGLNDEERQKIDNIIENIFSGLNDPKPSYHEFKNLLDSLKKVIVGNKQLYDAALVSLGASNGGTAIDKSWLVSNIDQIVASLNSEILEFEKAVDSKLINETSSFDKTSKEIEEELSQLIAKQQELMAKKQTLTDAINELKVKSEAKKNYYRSVMESRINDIQVDRSNLSTN